MLLIRSTNQSHLPCWCYFRYGNNEKIWAQTVRYYIRSSSKINHCYHCYHFFIFSIFAFFSMSYTKGIQWQFHCHEKSQQAEISKKVFRNGNQIHIALSFTFFKTFLGKIVQTYIYGCLLIFEEKTHTSTYLLQGCTVYIGKYPPLGVGGNISQCNCGENMTGEKRKKRKMWRKKRTDKKQREIEVKMVK